MLSYKANPYYKAFCLVPRLTCVQRKNHAFRSSSLNYLPEVAKGVIRHNINHNLSSVATNLALATLDMAEWAFTTRHKRHEFEVILVSICNGISIPPLALFTAMRQLQSLNIEFKIIDTIIVEHSDQANQIGRAVLDRHGYPGNLHLVRKLEDLSHWIDQHFGNSDTIHWQDKLLIILAGTPCKSISFGCSKNINRDKFGLHASPSNLWFLAQESINKLCTLFPSYRRIVFIENVVPPNKEDLQELDKTAGIRSTMEPQAVNAKRSRCVWTSIPLHLHHNYKFPYPLYDIAEDWCFQHNRVFPTIRAIFPKLFWQAFENPSTVSLQDMTTIDDCIVLHKPTNAPRLPSIPVWATLMGFDLRTISAITSTFPCSLNIRCLDQSNNAITTACGAQVLCPNCSTILQHIGEAWHLSTATKHLYSLLLNFVEIHNCIEDPIQHFELVSFPYNYPIHQCSISCSRARTKLI